MNIFSSTHWTVGPVGHLLVLVGPCWSLDALDALDALDSLGCRPCQKQLERLAGFVASLSSRPRAGHGPHGGPRAGWYNPKWMMTRGINMYQC